METTSYDLVIIGAGAAGIAAALAAQKKLKKILIVCKGGFLASGSTFINLNNRWGLTFAENQQERQLLDQTINQISQNTNSPALTSILVRESLTAFEFLRDLGVAFLTDQHDQLLRVPPCFSSSPLAVIIQSCKQFAQCIEKKLDWLRITPLPHTRVRHITTRHGRVSGIIAENKSQIIRIKAKSVIVASGGMAASLPPHIVEPGLVGDGYRLLKDLGLVLANMQYQQRVWEDVSLTSPRFQTSFFTQPDYIFQNHSGETISLSHISDKTIKTRLTHVPISNLQSDKAIDDVLLSHCSKGQPIIVTHLPDSTVINRILPHTQVSNGGLIIGEQGETDIPGLFAAGEVTTGMHGGDRVGGMMITNCLVFGGRAGMAAADSIA